MTNYLHRQLIRQAEHWVLASQRLRNLDGMASPNAWAGMESYLNVTVKNSLLKTIDKLIAESESLKTKIYTAKNKEGFEQAMGNLEKLRKQYFKIETTLNFFTDAINTRTNPEVTAWLNACDHMAFQSMYKILTPLGKTPPPVLTYYEKGLGAMILKYGLRLWDRYTVSPAAMIKIARQNAERPTSLIHESGHQVAHQLNWNNELRSLLSRELPKEIGRIWASWASEIAADAFAFVHTGYAAVAGLHDVLSGSQRWVFRFIDGDPHPISYVRVLLGIAMCRLFYGAGPWDEMEKAWKYRYPLSGEDEAVKKILKESIPILKKIAQLTLSAPMKAFGGKALTYYIDPGQVAPDALHQFEKRAGQALYTSSHWVNVEALRMLALSGYKIAVQPSQTTSFIRDQRKWMLRLGQMNLIPILN